MQREGIKDGGNEITKHKKDAELLEETTAGEAGRGFAVVAGEIGNLAGESALAANNTREQICMGIEDIANSIQDSSAMAEECPATSEELAAQAVTLNNMIGKFEF